MLHVWPDAASRGRAVVFGYPVAAALALLTPFTPAPIHLAALVLTALVATSAITTRPRQLADA